MDKSHSYSERCGRTGMLSYVALLRNNNVAIEGENIHINNISGFKASEKVDDM